MQAKARKLTIFAAGAGGGLIRDTGDASAFIESIVRQQSIVLVQAFFRESLEEGSWH